MAENAQGTSENGSRRGKNGRWDVLDAAFLLVLFLGVLFISWHSFRGEFTCPQAAGNAMDGLFSRDLLFHGGWRHPSQLAGEYSEQGAMGQLLKNFRFVHPFFLGLVFALLGPSFFSAHVAALAALVAFVFCWYLWIARDFDKIIAFFSSLLVLTSLAVARWSGEPMAEFPALALLCASGLFYTGFLKRANTRSLFAASVCFGLAFLTDKAAFMFLPVFIISPLFLGGYGRFSRKKVLWVAIVWLLMILPATVLEISAGKAADSLGATASAFSISNWTGWTALLTEAPTAPAVALLGIAGIFYALARRDGRVAFLAIFALSYFSYGLMTPDYLRTALFWVPPLSVIAVYFIIEMGGSGNQLAFKKVIVVLLLFLQFLYLHRKGESYYVRGYEEAARYVASNPLGESVVMQGYQDGNFIFAMRGLAPEGFKVLPARGLLTSEKLLSETGVMTPVQSREEFFAIFKNYGAQYVVLESYDVKNAETAQQKMLREIVLGPRFDLKTAFPIRSNDPDFKDLKLYVYALREPEPLEIKPAPPARKPKAPPVRRRKR